MFQLKNWHLDVINGRVMGFGNCYDNPKFPPGFYVHTSWVLKIQADENEKRLLLFTRTGNCYETKFAEILPCMIDRTEEVLQSQGILWKMIGKEKNK